MLIIGITGKRSFRRNGRDQYMEHKKKYTLSKREKILVATIVSILALVIAISLFAGASKKNLATGKATSPSESNQCLESFSAPVSPSTADYTDKKEPATECTIPLQETATEAVPEATEESESPTEAAIIVDPNCNHIFEVIQRDGWVKLNCRFCGISEEDLRAIDPDWKRERCEECTRELVIQTNSTPAYECTKCHNIMICPSPDLSQLKLLSDTNEEGSHEDVKFGEFYEQGRTWDATVRFWVADKPGWSNTESLEVYLGSSYETLFIMAYAGEHSDKDANMTLRFYGDGEFLYEMNDIVFVEGDDAYDATVDISNVDVLKVECCTDVDAFGYCFLCGVVWY